MLKQFSSSRRDLGVTELATRLGLGKSTVHRLLATLVEERFVEQDSQTGRYRLGLAAFELGAAASSPTDLHQAVLMPMSVLRIRTGETVQTAVLDGRQVVYVERLESPNTLRLFLEVGTRNDAHSTGTGKCLLAYLDDTQLDRLLHGWDLPAKTPAHHHRPPAAAPGAEGDPGARLGGQPPRVRGRGHLGRRPRARRRQAGRGRAVGGGAGRAHGGASSPDHPGRRRGRGDRLPACGRLTRRLFRDEEQRAGAPHPVVSVLPMPTLTPADRADALYAARRDRRPIPPISVDDPS